MKNRFLVSLFPLIFCILFLVACGDKATVKTEDGGQISVETDKDGNNKLIIETDEGKIVSEISSNAKIPEAFPSDFPFPKSTSFDFVQTTSDGTSVSHMISFFYTEDSQEVFENVKKFVENNGMDITWEQISETEGVKYYILFFGIDEKLFQLTLDDSSEISGFILYTGPK